MIFYDIPDYDNYRFEDAEEFDGLRDTNELYELETYDLPVNCPYRQFMPPTSHFFNIGGAKPPTSPPPNFTPTRPTTAITPKPIDIAALGRCTNRFSYIWPRRGRGFWAYLTFVGRRSASGFRWDGRRWTYFATALRNIEHFQCY